MARGLIFGLFWGALVSALVVAIISLVSGLPLRTAQAPSSVDVGVPAGSEFNRNRPESIPVIPQAEVADIIADAPAVAAPQTEAAPETDTEPAATPAPEVSQPVAPEAPSTQTGDGPLASLGDAGGALVQGDAPALSTPPTDTETVPTAPTMPVIRRAAKIVQTEVEPPAPTPAPEPAPEVAAPQAPSLEIEPAVTAAPKQPEVEIEPAVAAAPAPSGADAAQPAVEKEPRVIKLPRIGGVEADQPADADVATSEDPQAEDAVDPSTLGALARNSVPFDATGDDRSLFSVVLIDVGNDGLDRETMTTFSFPVTIAIDPSRPDASRAADAYRAAGFEVLILVPPVASGATAGEVSASVSAYVEALPQAIGLVDAAANGFGANRRLVERVIEVLSVSDHGLLTYDRGLNTALQLAEREGLPAAAIFRVLDADREKPTTIKRYLDRAAFKATQEGRVVMIGHSYADTVMALFSWVLEPRSESVRMAPMSAIMRR